ncbi:MAG: copper-binding protein [Rhodocyclales bacterium]|nr:copper-binding protein [Rhodocyclales bacterium]
MKQHLLRAATAAALAFLLQPVQAMDHSAHVAPAAKAAGQAMSEGTIRKLDLSAGKVSIAHGEIANLKMPPMTMTFSAGDPAMLKGFKEGDKVRFRAAEVGGKLTVVGIEAAK